jgi:hypothetical protein
MALGPIGVRFRAIGREASKFKARSRPAAVKAANDGFGRKPTFLRPHRNGVSWSAAADKVPLEVTNTILEICRLLIDRP